MRLARFLRVSTMLALIIIHAAGTAHHDNGLDENYISPTSHNVAWDDQTANLNEAHRNNRLDENYTSPTGHTNATTMAVMCTAETAHHTNGSDEIYNSPTAHQQATTLNEDRHTRRLDENCTSPTGHSKATATTRAISRAAETARHPNGPDEINILHTVRTNTTPSNAPAPDRDTAAVTTELQLVTPSSHYHYLIPSGTGNVTPLGSATYSHDPAHDPVLKARGRRLPFDPTYGNQKTPSPDCDSWPGRGKAEGAPRLPHTPNVCVVSLTIAPFQRHRETYTPRNTGSYTGGRSRPLHDHHTQREANLQDRHQLAPHRDHFQERDVEDSIAQGLGTDAAQNVFAAAAAVTSAVSNAARRGLHALPRSTRLRKSWSDTGTGVRTILIILMLLVPGVAAMPTGVTLIPLRATGCMGVLAFLQSARDNVTSVSDNAARCAEAWGSTNPELWHDKTSQYYATLPNTTTTGAVTKLVYNAAAAQLAAILRMALKEQAAEKEQLAADGVADQTDGVAIAKAIFAIAKENETKGFGEKQKINRTFSNMAQKPGECVNTYTLRFLKAKQELTRLDQAPSWARVVGAYVEGLTATAKAHAESYMATPSFQTMKAILNAEEVETAAKEQVQFDSLKDYMTNTHGGIINDASDPSRVGNRGTVANIEPPPSPVTRLIAALTGMTQRKSQGNAQKGKEKNDISAEICNKFQTGSCRFGDKCRRKHKCKACGSSGHGDEHCSKVRQCVVCRSTEHKANSDGTCPKRQKHKDSDGDATRDLINSLMEASEAMKTAGQGAIPGATDRIIASINGPKEGLREEPASADDTKYADGRGALGKAKWALTKIVQIAVGAVLAVATLTFAFYAMQFVANVPNLWNLPKTGGTIIPGSGASMGRTPVNDTPLCRHDGHFVTEDGGPLSAHRNNMSIGIANVTGIPGGSNGIDGEHIDFRRCIMLVDTGASACCCPTREYFCTYQPVSYSCLATADGTPVKILGVGNINVKCATGKVFTIRAYHTPDFGQTILSTNELRNSCTFVTGKAGDFAILPCDTVTPLNMTGTCPRLDCMILTDRQKWIEDHDPDAAAPGDTNSTKLADALANATVARVAPAAARQPDPTTPTRATPTPARRAPEAGSTKKNKGDFAQACLLHRYYAHFGMEDICGTISRGNIKVPVAVSEMLKRKGWQSEFAKHHCMNCVKGNARHDSILTRVPAKEPTAHREPNPPTATRPFEVVHTDICVVAKPGIFGIGAKKRYVVGFIDEKTGYAYCAIINSRKDLPAAVKKYVEHLHQNRLIGSVANSSITMQSDNEYDSLACKRIYADCGIKARYSAAKSPMSNAKIERFWGTITPAIVRTLGDSQLPLDYWDACLYHVVDIYNSLGHRATSYVSPNNMCFQTATNHTKLALFGAPTAVLIEKQDRSHKFSQRASFGLNLGFAPDHSKTTCALVWNPDTKRTTVTRHQRSFDYPEHAATNPLELVRRLNKTTDAGRQIQRTDGDTHAGTDSPVNAGSDPNVSPHPSIRENDTEDVIIASVTRRTEDGGSEVEEFELPFEHTHAFRRLVTNKVQAVLPFGITPKNWTEAVTCQQSAAWMNAVDDEFNGKIEVGCYRYVDQSSLPQDATVLWYVWDFRIKNGIDGKPYKYKARLCPNGAGQRAGHPGGYDEDEVSAPVAEKAAIKAVAAIAVAKDLLTGTFDVCQAYPNAHLERRDIYMHCPPRFRRIGTDGKPQVLQCLRSDYGLVQSGANFGVHLRTCLETNGFKRSDADPCIMIRKGPRNELMICAIYVDDIYYAVDSERSRNKFKKLLQKEYSEDGEGGITHVPATQDQPLGLLGMRVHDKTTEKGRFIHFEMSNATSAALQDYGMKDANTAKTPFELSKVEDLSARNDKERDEVKKFDIKNLLGRLLWISTCCRPDICWAVNFCARHAHDPSPRLWTAMKHVLRYLKGTAGHGLTYYKEKGASGDIILDCYVDTDHGGCPTTFRSTTGAIYRLNGIAVHWKSKRQGSATRSSTEAEMMGVAEAVADVKFLRGLLASIGHEQGEPTRIYCDNAGAVTNAKNLTNKRSKHLNIDYAVVRDAHGKQVRVTKVATDENVADAGTKALGPTKIQQHRPNMGVQAPPANIKILGNAIIAATNYLASKIQKCHADNERSPNG